MQSELKPCPFCGGIDELSVCPSTGSCNVHFIACADCGCEGPFEPTHTEAVTAWNTRASDAEITRLTEALKTQAAAVRTLHANEQTEINMLRAKAREAHIAITTLDSEREANAILTEALRAAEEREKALREALGEMVYETTHLSPMKANGDHDCTIKANTLERARAALKEQPHD